MHIPKLLSFLNFLKNGCELGVAVTGISSAVASDSDILAIIGGQQNAPYAAFVKMDGSVEPLSGLPPTGLTYRVALNSHDMGLIGGTSGLNAYAALVSANGQVTPIESLIAPGEIYSVALNDSGKGIIGGGHFNSNVPYAALISRTGKAQALNVPASGLIYGVAIGDSQQGIIGGKGPLNSAYAALVSPSGKLEPIQGLPVTGAIFWVAVGDSQWRFIGGQANNSLYAAFVSRQGDVRPIVNLPEGTNYSVAINKNGAAIMGGTFPVTSLCRARVSRR